MSTRGLTSRSRTRSTGLYLNNRTAVGLRQIRNQRPRQPNRVLKGPRPNHQIKRLAVGPSRIAVNSRTIKDKPTANASARRGTAMASTTSRELPRNETRPPEQARSNRKPLHQLPSLQSISSSLIMQMSKCTIRTLTT